MYKKIINFTIFILIICIYCLVFKKYQVLVPSLIDTSIMFIKNVFPFLFITIILNYLLIDFNLPSFFRNNYIYVFFMSILSGCPTNAIIIEQLLNKNKINENDASMVLAFTTFNNPLFLYHYLNKILLNKWLVIKAILIIYITNIISKSINAKMPSRTLNIQNSLTKSIKNSINQIINIYATILFFKMISDLFISPTTILRGFIEITQGLNVLSTVNISIKTKELLSLVILNFGGLSIHIQIASVLKNYNINYKYFYTTRLLYSLLSFIILII